MALVEAKPAGASTSAADPLFVVVLDGVETPIREGTLYGAAGGTVTVTAPGHLAAEGLRSVLVRAGAGGAATTARFTLCGDAAAEGVGAVAFDRCGAARAEGAREVSAARCRAAEVERAGKVTLERCRDARLRGGGALRAARCRSADVESFGGARLARCKAARLHWCGTVEVDMCRALSAGPWPWRTPRSTCRRRRSSGCTESAFSAPAATAPWSEQMKRIWQLQLQVLLVRSACRWNAKSCINSSVGFIVRD